MFNRSRCAKFTANTHCFIFVVSKRICMETKTSKEWYDLVYKEHKLLILDPDGWDRKNYEYSFNEELITKEEFKQRVSKSTIQCRHSFFVSEW